MRLLTNMLNDTNKPNRCEINLQSLNKNKIAICRCWKSKKFPYCDGSHNQYNEDNNDSLGPAIIKIEE